MSLIDKVTAISALIIAIGVIASSLIKFYKWVSKPKETEEDLKKIDNKQKEDIKAIKTELCMTTYCLLACLDGLKQLGANGNVTEAHDRLQKYLNQQAHDMGESA